MNYIWGFIFLIIIFNVISIKVLLTIVGIGILIFLIFIIINLMNDNSLSKNKEYNLFEKYLSKYFKNGFYFDNKTNELIVDVKNLPIKQKYIKNVYSNIDETIKEKLEVFLTKRKPSLPSKFVQGKYESTKDFKKRISNEQETYSLKADRYNQLRKNYISTLETLNKDGYKKTIYEKILGKKNYHIYDDIFKIYTSSIKEYYNEPYIEDIFYNPDTKKLYIKQKFTHFEDVFLMEFNVNVSIAKEIIDNKNFESMVIFKTDFKSVDIQVLVAVNGILLKSVKSKVNVQKPILQEVIIQLDELKEKNNININNIEFSHSNINNEGLPSLDLKKFTKEIDDLKVKLKLLENRTEDFDSMTIEKHKNLQNDNYILEKAQIDKTIKEQTTIISRLKEDFQYQADKINNESEAVKKLTELLNNSLDKINKINNSLKKQEEKINFIKNNSSEREKDNLIKQLQERLIKKEEETQKIIEQFTFKFEKLEKSLSMKQKTTKKPFNHNTQVKNKSLNQNNGVIVKRESFDDF